MVRSPALDDVPLKGTLWSEGSMLDHLHRQPAAGGFKAPVLVAVVQFP